MAYLIVREPGRVAYTTALRAGLRVGRQADNDLPLADRQVSRYHLRFELVDGDRFEVVDLESRHGTLVNGLAATRVRLAAGDQIQIGNILLHFADGAEPSEVLEPHRTAAAPPLGRLESDRGRLAIFYELGRALGQLGDSDELLRRLLIATVEVLGCERGTIGLCDENERAALRCIRHGGGSDGDEPVLSATLRAAVLERRESVVISAALDRPHSMVRARIRSAMTAPLIFGDRLLGLLYVDDRTRDDRFSDADLEFLNALAHFIAASLASAELFHRAAVTIEALREGQATDALIGASPAMQHLKREIQLYATAPGARVFIRGESGTGKELVARTLHDLSPRAAQPFVAVNCAAIPETMIESELFGHEKGAFTGALRERRGKLALADRGTLFLDEVGDLSLAAQAKLLRAIEEGEVQPLGSDRTLRVDLRVLSATHKDLRVEVAEKRFREDLLYRLNVVEIEVPALRDRPGDVALLAQTFVERAAQRLGKRLTGLTPAAVEALAAHRWPGNVRELQNEVERAAIVARGPIVDAGDLSPRVIRSPAGDATAMGPATAPPSLGVPLHERFAQLEVTERALVEQALAEARGNVAEAARLLGITRVMMKRRIDRFRTDEGESG